MYRGSGLGFLPMLAAAGMQTAGGMATSKAQAKAAKEAADLQRDLMAAQMKMHRRDLRAEEASSRLFGATTQQGKTLRTVFLSIAGVALVGAGLLYLGTKGK
jgi:hypothetical protein